MFVCLFSDRPKEKKGHLFFFQFCILKQNYLNKMSEYMETVPKRHFNLL